MQTVRAELEAAQSEMYARKRLPLFQLQEMTLEFDIVAGEKVTSEGGAEMWVLSGKVGTQDQSEFSQTVRLTYKIVPASEGGSLSGERFHSTATHPQEESIIEVLPKVQQ